MATLHRLALRLKEQWYRCVTCGYNFPASEASGHKGHNYYPIAGTSE